MSDIFNRTPLNFGGAFAADAAQITFSGFDSFQSAGDAAGTLAQNLQVSYNQPIVRLYELGGLNEYFVVGRPQGNGVINRVIGPRVMLYSFYRTFGDACNALENNMNILAETACNENDAINPLVATGDKMEFTVRHCVLTTYGFSVAAQDMVFNESLPFMFISLDIPDDEL